MSRRRSPLPRGWGAIRRGVLERDRWQCQIKGQRCTGRASEVDHVGDRDNHSGANLRAACTRCHAQRTAQQARAAQLSVLRPAEPHPGIIR